MPDLGHREHQIRQDDAQRKAHPVQTQRIFRSQSQHEALGFNH